MRLMAAMDGFLLHCLLHRFFPYPHGNCPNRAKATFYITDRRFLPDNAMSPKKSRESKAGTAQAWSCEICLAISRFEQNKEPFTLKASNMSRGSWIVSKCRCLRLSWLGHSQSEYSCQISTLSRDEDSQLVS